MKLVLFLLLLVIAGMAHIRFSPTDPARWHIDPASASDPGRAGDLRLHRADMAPDRAVARFDEIARAAPRVILLAGSVAEGRMTYVVRSKWFGFPDYVTVTSVPEGDGSVLIVLSRLRFGGSGSGVNGARLDLWLQRFDAVQD